ncbi:MAG: phosphotransferase [Sphingobacteriales bacterium]|nr:phosphotransferase [Sphingobacteriales bacterium]
MHEEILKHLFREYFKEDCFSILQLPQAGSDRIYFRLKGAAHIAIGTFGKDAKENETFIHHTHHFHQKQIAVPQVFIASENKQYYLQEDLGDTSLYTVIKKEGITEVVVGYLRKVLLQLTYLQIKGAEGFDFSSCYPIQEFNKSSMFWDLNGFKYYFARIARVQFSEIELNKDFHTLCDYLLQEPHSFFMFRDCQSRNIMIYQDKPYFIDYQGGRKGALQYDAASLLWQAGAKIPYPLREDLLEFYCQHVAALININKVDFKERYYGFVLIRMLQVLGAYGFRGLIEKRSHFIESIIPALENVRWFLKNVQLKIELPELKSVLQQLIVSDAFKEEKFDGSSKQLKININSFSYRRGIPADATGNGGGFVFDCRGLHNPGRYEAYKQLTGKDVPVIEFLESKSKVKDFLENVSKLIDVNIQDYLARDFEHLQINFGCTGGQHRSVYCAEQTARYIQERYKIKVQLKHIERELQGQFI